MADFKAALQHNPQVQISFISALCSVIVLNNVIGVSIFSMEYTLKLHSTKYDQWDGTGLRLDYKFDFILTCMCSLKVSERDFIGLNMP